MKYIVMYRGHAHLRTDNLSDARKKIEQIGDSAYIKYSNEAIREYERDHVPLKGSEE